MSRLFISIFLSALLVALHNIVASAQANSMIPLSKDGHAYHRGNTSSETVVEFFIDLTCSSCLDSWPLLTQVYETYKDKVHFEYRVFPLPYHQQGFIVAKAAQVVQVLGDDNAVFTFFDTAYANQAEIYNTNTMDSTYNDIVKLVSDWAVKGTGLTEDQYYVGMNSSNAVGSQCEMNTRYMWKYVCIQGIFATPLFQIDGLKVGGLDTFEDWQAALGPLIA